MMPHFDYSMLANQCLEEHCFIILCSVKDVNDIHQLASIR